MGDLKQKKIDRFRFLKDVYDKTDGHTLATVSMWDVGEKLGFTPDYTAQLIDYLDGENLTQHVALGGEIGITHWGVKEVERIL
ncbi:hypothetical protein KKH18_10335, partial [bacterium]|nr:hypothetical protein [bacterium]